MTDPSKRVTKWADKAMFEAEPVNVAEGPKVYLLEMTHDPLGSIAALSAMYTGKVIRDKDAVTDAERAHHLSEMQKTKLTTPLEAVKLHFMIEGVTRAFTHQLVRNRTSAYAQESMRFAVKEDMPVALPPSLLGSRGWGEIMEEWSGRDWDDFYGRLPDKDQMRWIWDTTVGEIRTAYNKLVDMGMPAEDARGLAPTNVLTRINWVTDLRTLLDVMGVRLCTQAQFEWRVVASGIAQAIRTRYADDVRYQIARMAYRESSDSSDFKEMQQVMREYYSIAGLLAPICYKTGKCEFMSDADRECSIRNRVQANHDVGRKSTEWAEEYDHVEGNPIVAGVGPRSIMREAGPNDSDDVPTGKPVFIGAIQPAEWLLDPSAAR